MKTPFIGFSNNTLKELSRVNIGDPIVCPNCGNIHTLKDPERTTKYDYTTGKYVEFSKETPILMFYKCEDSLYLGAVDGKLVVGVGADVSGEI